MNVLIHQAHVRESNAELDGKHMVAVVEHAHQQNKGNDCALNCGGLKECNATIVSG